MYAFNAKFSLPEVSSCFVEDDYFVMPQEKPPRTVVSYHCCETPRAGEGATEDLPAHIQNGSQSKQSGTEVFSNDPKDIRHRRAGNEAKYQNANGLLGLCVDEAAEEAQIPAPFEYFEPEDDMKSNQKRHVSAELPQFYTLGDAPENLEQLPPLEYYLWILR